VEEGDGEDGEGEEDAEMAGQKENQHRAAQDI